MEPAFVPTVFVTSFNNVSGLNQRTSATTPARQPTSTNRLLRAVAEPHIQATDKSTDVFTSIQENVANTYARYPLVISHGAGSELFDIDGNRYVDCVAGIATCTLGHAHPAIVKAVTEQVSKVTHVSNLYFVPPQADLANWLVQHSPADKVFFCNSGAEANEAAIKLMRKFWHRKHQSTPSEHGTPVIITANQSFHGRTLATLTATGQPKYHANWWPIVEGFEYIDYNDVDSLRDVCERLGDNLAGIMLEALQGEGGVHPISGEFINAAREACDQAGALLSFDEVQVGMGRTGKLWGFENTDVEPDIFTLAKGLAGGVPIGATLWKAHCDVFEPGDHASTFGGNPLATAAGCAVAREMVEGGVLENVKERGDQLGNALEVIAGRYPDIVKEVRGWGLIRGVEVVGVSAPEIVAEAMKNNVLILPAGPSVVRFVPPLVITEEQIDEAVACFENALLVVSGRQNKIN